MRGIHLGVLGFFLFAYYNPKERQKFDFFY